MKQYLDLSRIIEDKMPVYPGDDPTLLFQTANIKNDHFASFRLETNMHVGTHLDAPLHFIENSKYISDYPVDIFAGKAVLIDVREIELIGLKDEYERLISEEDIVLFCTGFSEFYGTANYYSKHPILTLELAEFLARKKIKMVGLDTPSPDRDDYLIHHKLLSNDIFIIENLCNLEKLLPYDSFEIAAFPLKIKAEASPVRVVAII